MSSLTWNQGLKTITVGTKPSLSRLLYPVLSHDPVSWITAFLPKVLRGHFLRILKLQAAKTGINAQRKNCLPHFGIWELLQNFLCSPPRIPVTGHIHWKRTPVYINESVKFSILVKYCLHYSWVPSYIDLNQWLIKCYPEVIMGPVPMNIWEWFITSH